MAVFMWMTLICPVYSQLNSQSVKKYQAVPQNCYKFHGWIQGSANRTGLTIAYFIKLAVRTSTVNLLSVLVPSPDEQRWAQASGLALVSLTKGRQLTQDLEFCRFRSETDHFEGKITCTKLAFSGSVQVQRVTETFRCDTSSTSAKLQ